jgi:hypothetical protein
VTLGSFLVEVALFVGLATIIGLPVMAVAYRRDEILTLRRFLLGGVAVGILVAILSTTSDMLVSRCLDAGNTGCLDYGAVGIQTLILVIYGVASLIATVRLLRG